MKGGKEERERRREKERERKTRSVPVRHKKASRVNRAGGRKERRGTGLSSLVIHRNYPSEFIPILYSVVVGENLSASWPFSVEFVRIADVGHMRCLEGTSVTEER